MSNKQQCISVKACFSLLFYLVIPSIAIIFIMHAYPELSRERFIRMIYWILPTSVVIVCLAQCSLFYQKGETKRYLLNIAFVGTTLLWIYGLLGGNTVITNQWNEYFFSVHMTKYITLIIIVSIVNIIYYTLEWKFYRHTAVTKNTQQRVESTPIELANP